ncbi:NAD(P)H dehydrogenase (quinone) [Evansella caseinilytica]|uniref:NAD(P)H dehydrogenase (Quinone) n=1 Tax=Evansella caseinilytica TaxID=1503961 RepID=A0A1H3R5E8_9BACI|nr:NmrA family NAD(P)-binding protein [Evansella caseinilytica]SDZ20169.1 NAD(P)H dehydrogenase (quinone) [Evansella caseinilytica]
MRYIVTGADGQLGGRVAANMLKKVSGDQLIFTSPNISRIAPEALKAWKEQGVTVREADYNDKKQMTEAFRGGDRIYIVSGVVIGSVRVQQHKNAIDAAIAAGVKHITYTSFLGANREGYYQFVLPDHTETEAYLRKTGIEYNIMRNNLYLENYFTNSVMLAFLSDEKWYTAAGEGKATFIAKDDSGRVATALLLGKGEPNKAYDVVGGELISQREICALISEAAGIHFQYISLDNEAFYDYLDSIHIPRDSYGDYSQSPVPWCSNDMVTNEASIRDGLMAIEADTVEKLTGKKPLTARYLIDQYSFVWRNRVTKYADLNPNVTSFSTKPQ